MSIKLNINKKVLIAIAGFILFIGILSVGYLLLNPASNQSVNNPGGTGGDYIPPNSVNIINSGVLYDYLGGVDADKVTGIISDVVLYDINLSEDPNATPDYIQLSNFKPDESKLYKKNTSYTVTIGNDQINTVDNSPDYWFTFTTSDGRHFRLDDHSDDNGNDMVTVKKTS